MTTVHEFFTKRNLTLAGLETVWKQEGDRLIYPLFDYRGNIIPNVQRFRCTSANPSQRFGWIKPPDTKVPRLFWHPNAQARMEAIDSTHTLYLCSGETDALTLYCNGYANVTAYFGESNTPTPEEITAFRDSLKITALIHILDNDTAGAKSSQSVFNALKGSGIAYTAYSPLESFKDINEQWVKEKKITPMRSVSYAQAETKLGGYDFAKLNAEITRILRASYKLDTASRGRCACPVHVGDSPTNAHWNEQTGTLTCFSQCATTYHTIDLIQQAGWNIDTNAYRLEIPIEYTKPTPPSAPSQPTPTPPPPQPTWGYISQAQAALSHFETMQPSAIPAEVILNPITTLHPFGGNALMLQPRKLTAIIGGTGMGKTTAVESLFILPLIRNGYEVLMMGYEWSPEQYISRHAVRMLDIPLDAIQMHQLWAYEQALRNNGQPATKRGIPLNPDKLSAYTALIAEMSARTQGQVWYYDELQDTNDYSEQQLQAILDIATLRDLNGELRAYVIQTIDLVTRLRAEGKRIGVIVYDYIQLLTLDDRDPYNAVKKTVNLLKILATRLNVHIIVTSQAKKGDTEDITGDTFTTVNDDGTVKRLKSGSGEYLPGHAFNLILSVVPAFMDGDSLGYAQLEVHKNNTGKANGTVLIVSDLPRLMLYDRPYQISPF